jgi:hypothetical protein
MGTILKTVESVGTIHRGDDASQPAVGSDRKIELTIADTYQSVGDDKVLTTTDISGRVEISGLSDTAGDWILRLEDGRTMPFYFHNAVGGWGFITPRGSFK